MDRGQEGNEKKEHKMELMCVGACWSVKSIKMLDVLNDFHKNIYNNTVSGLLIHPGVRNNDFKIIRKSH